MPDEPLRTPAELAELEGETVEHDITAHLRDITEAGLIGAILDRAESSTIEDRLIHLRVPKTLSEETERSMWFTRVAGWTQLYRPLTLEDFDDLAEELDSEP